MTEIAYAIPIVRGKEDLYRQTWDELAGARRDEYAAAQKDAGVTRQAVWHQQTAEGRTLAIIYIEEPILMPPSALSRLMRTSVGGLRSGCRKYMDAISRSRLFRSSWITTSASNG
jgi:hypothetical protein